MQLSVVAPSPPVPTRVVPHGWQPTVTLADLLATRGAVDVPPEWWSGDGIHGSLLVALAAADAAALAPHLALRGSTAQLLGPVRGRLELSSRLVHAGPRVTTVRTVGAVGSRNALVVHSTFAVTGGRAGIGAVDAVPAPLVHAPEDLPGSAPRTDVVPFGRQVEVRPTDEVQAPAGAGASVRRTAWVRLHAGAGAPGPLGTIVVADALAPALHAGLDSPARMPLVEMAVHHRAPSPTAEGGRTIGDPWLLVRTRTDLSDEGWLSEVADVWDRDGTHVATSRQLRLAS